MKSMMKSYDIQFDEGGDQQTVWQSMGKISSQGSIKAIRNFF